MEGKWLVWLAFASGIFTFFSLVFYAYQLNETHKSMVEFEESLECYNALLEEGNAIFERDRILGKSDL